MSENGNKTNEDGGVTRAIAKFTFSGKNNDELSFEKNDIILVTQQLDGGWWEGNLDNKIGWFPSDFVGIICNNSEGWIRSIYIKFNDEEGSILGSNLEQIIRLKAQLLENVVNQAKLELNQQRIGGAFLDAAPRLKELLTEYCLNHPSVVSLLNSKRAVFDDFLKKRNLELKELISGLSLVFRHIEKYAVVLQEIERNYPDTHADRGNLQRAGYVYRSIWQDCAYLRKQKEVQIEFLSQNYLEKWFGPQYPSILGEMIYIGGVTVGNARDSVGGQVVDRKIALFTKMLLFLESSLPSNEYTLCEKFATNDLTVNKDENAMSIEFRRGPAVLIIVNSLTNEDFQQLIDALTSCTNVTFSDTSLLLHTVAPASPQKLMASDVQKMTDVSPLKKIEVHQLPQAQQPQLTKKPSNSGGFAGMRLDHDLQMFVPDGIDENDGPLQIQPQNTPSNGGSGRRGKIYSGYCLRPYPAPRGGPNEDLSKIKLRKGMTGDEQEDAILLRIVDGFCSASSQLPPLLRSGGGSGNPLRRTVSHNDESRPHLIVAEEEKIFVEEKEGDAIVYKERTLVDTVYSLKDQVNILQKELETMKNSFEKEQKARRRLEDSLRRSSQQYSVSSTPKPTETEQSQ
uniref:Uncharacterized protein n=1 Tax=Panagrolaimus superbus TaxID=310955 RepID=A0A914XWX9_9BILA